MVELDPLPKIRLVPFTVKLPPRVVNPVPVVIGALFVVLRLRSVGEFTRIFPVFVPPRVRLSAFCVWILPLASRERALPLVIAETLAVGVPLATLRNANLAEEVELPPIPK